MMDNQSDISSKPGSSGWHIALEKATGEGQYLGDMKVVGHIVRQHIKGVVDRYVAVTEGESAPWAAANGDKAACELMARVFLGKEAGFTPMGAWNTEAGLGAFLSTEIERLVAPADRADGGQAVAQAFALATHKVYEVIGTVSGEGDDLAEQTHLLQELADQLTRALMGVHTELFEH